MPPAIKREVYSGNFPVINIGPPITPLLPLFSMKLIKNVFALRALIHRAWFLRITLKKWVPSPLQKKNKNKGKIILQVENLSLDFKDFDTFFLH